MSDDDQIPLNEAVEIIMKNRGVSRRTARRMLLRRMADGSVRVTGTLVRPGLGGEMISSGRREIIPPEFFAGAKVRKGD